MVGPEEKRSAPGWSELVKKVSAPLFLLSAFASSILKEEPVKPPEGRFPNSVNFLVAVTQV